MAKYRLNANVRLKNTLVIVTIVDIFEDATETKYAVLTGRGIVLEKKESEIRPPLSAIYRYVMHLFDNWVRDNPIKTIFIFGVTGYVLGMFAAYILQKLL